MSRYGINCPICYTDAYTSFGVKCLVAPHLANNAAVLARMKITAPEGCLVNAPYPAPVTARAVIGQMLPDAAFGCFAKAMPEDVPAEGTSASWSLRLGGGAGVTGDANGKATNFQVSELPVGRHGRPSAPRRHVGDGLSVRRQDNRRRGDRGDDAAGLLEARTADGFRAVPARYRGGLGQSMEVGSREDAPFAIFAVFSAKHFRRSAATAAAMGRLDGSD